MNAEAKSMPSKVSKQEIARRIRELNDFLLPHVACLAITPSHGSRPYQMLGAGTASLLELDGRQILVTCSHVYTEFKEARASNPQTELAAIVADRDGTYSLGSPERKCWGELSGQSDLVAFDYPRLDRLPRSEKRYLPLQLNQIPDVASADTLVFTGFPGAFRKSFGCWVNVSCMLIPLVVTDVTETTIVAAAIELNTEVFQDMIDQWGGFSGSLAYLAHSSGTVWPVGIVREWSKLAGGCLLITRLRELKRLLLESKSWTHRFAPDRCQASA